MKRLNNQQVKAIREKFSSGNYTLNHLAQTYNVVPSCIWYIVMNKSHVDESYVPQQPAKA
jgi:hypothetical protein